MHQSPFCFIVVVWGDAYIDMLLRVSLRCFLSPNNIPSLTNLNESQFLFVTTKEDSLKIANAPIFKRLEHYIGVSFVELPPLVADDNIYTRMTLGYELGTEVALKHKACAVYLLPDCLISDGTFSSLEKYVQQGREVVLLPGPRIHKEQVISHVDSMGLSEDDTLNFESRQLAVLGMDFLHTEYKNYNWGNAGFTKWPHIVTWNIPEQKGLLIRAFHLHPLMIDYSKRAESVHFNKFDTIDGGFIKKNFLDLNKFLIETDSDNMLLFSMTESIERIEEGLLWSNSDKLKAILEMSQNGVLVNELQKIYFYYSFKLHAQDLNSAWADVEKESFNIVKEVLLTTPSSKTLSTIYFKIRKQIFNVLPSPIKEHLKKIYWKTREKISWLKYKLFSV